MNKICTSIRQSQKLIELGIDVSTADMCWQNNEFPVGFNDDEAVPAWSLSALLNLLPQEIFDGEYVINITEGCDNRWVLTYDHCENRHHSYYGLSTGAENLVDACVEMVLKLHELKLL